MNKFILLLTVLSFNTFIINDLSAQFTSFKEIAPLPARDYATREKPQAKVFVMDNSYWSILANETGTHLWRLEDNAWKHELELSTKNTRADYVVIDNMVHILLLAGPGSQFISIEYNSKARKFKYGKHTDSVIPLTLENDVEVASIDVDNTGRLWVASAGDGGKINVRWSNSPFVEWSAPITIAQGLNEDDICAIVSLPQKNQIAVMWSDQNAKRWGFKTHNIGEEPTKWSKDEVPAAQYALSQGSGMSDDHINIKVASDGTLYAAIKTGYDKKGYPLIGLLVRRPTGTWDNLYEVSQEGTLPIVVLNEEQNILKIIYTSATYGGDILYKETTLDNISFCTEHTLIKGYFNYATSIKRGYSKETVILASSETHVVGMVVTDDAAMRTPLPANCDAGEAAVELFAYPNPFLTQTTINFKLQESQSYTLTLYDSNGAKITQISSSSENANMINNAILDASKLSRGLYILKLETPTQVRSIKLVHER